MADAPPPDDRYAGEGCITLWLRLWILANIFGLFVAPFMIDHPMVRQELPDYRDWMLIPYMIAGTAQTVFVFGVLYRRMWGFVGLWIVGILVVALNTAAGLRVVHAVSNLAGLVLLYWVLQIGGERSGWSRLK